MNDLNFVAILAKLVRNGLVSIEEMGTIIDTGYVDTVILHEAIISELINYSEIEYLFSLYKKRNCVRVPEHNLESVLYHWPNFEKTLFYQNTLALGENKTEFTFEASDIYGGYRTTIELAFYAQNHGWIKVPSDTDNPLEYTYKTRNLVFPEQ
jgi:hypothetical protein